MGCPVRRAPAKSTPDAPGAGQAPCTETVRGGFRFPGPTVRGTARRRKPFGSLPLLVRASHPAPLRGPGPHAERLLSCEGKHSSPGPFFRRTRPPCEGGPPRKIRASGTAAWCGLSHAWANRTRRIPCGTRTRLDPPPAGTPHRGNDPPSSTRRTRRACARPIPRSLPGTTVPVARRRSWRRLIPKIDALACNSSIHVAKI